MSCDYLNHLAARVALQTSDPKVCRNRSTQGRSTQRRSTQGRRALGRDADNIEVELAGWQKKILKQIEREKPPSPTRVSRSNLQNLAYLQRRGKTAPLLSPHDAERYDSRTNKS